MPLYVSSRLALLSGPPVASAPALGTPTFIAEDHATGASGIMIRNVPAGTVTFRDGLTVLATETLDATGAASFETAALSGGTHTISVSYDGDVNHGNAGVASVTQTVTPAPVSVVVTPSARN